MTVRARMVNLVVAHAVLLSACPQPAGDDDDAVGVWVEAIDATVAIEHHYPDGSLCYIDRYLDRNLSSDEVPLDLLAEADIHAAASLQF